MPARAHSERRNPRQLRERGLRRRVRAAPGPGARHVLRRVDDDPPARGWPPSSGAAVRSSARFASTLTAITRRHASVAQLVDRADGGNMPALHTTCRHRRTVRRPARARARWRVVGDVAPDAEERVGRASSISGVDVEADDRGARPPNAAAVAAADAGRGAGDEHDLARERRRRAPAAAASPARAPSTRRRRCRPRTAPARRRAAAARSIASMVCSAMSRAIAGVPGVRPR